MDPNFLVSRSYLKYETLYFSNEWIPMSILFFFIYSDAKQGRNLQWITILIYDNRKMSYFW